ncbi:sigma-54 dependent transcriptional regulator [Sphingomonas sp.]|uniref:sigma-54-dependent transcriptional regulator n=1 Tax=Sphingomonas sp. TaxID=28214 RepID=UPI001B2C8043|nr:sigma-54 dependent transcriptional regulator [Sphingomonas sp.]MBO9713497.1 sigma-54-dependent Fis family transcriptional regulator [Sphingomonas sp.]
MAGTIRMLLVGGPGSAFREAAELARDAGAEAAMANDIEEAMSLLRERGGDLAMIDVECDVPAFMASLNAERFTLPVLACGVGATAEQAVGAIRAGARDYVPLPPERELIAAAIASVIAHRAPARIGDAPSFARAISLAEAVAPSGAPVLISGEPGCGKESVARRIHDASRRTGPMVTAECSGVASEVLESELFGHEAGAFPGAAARRIGRLEKARAGTIVLREVCSLSPALQSRLLSVLDDRRFKRVGGDEPLAFQARLIATTTSDLESRVREGTFRADLLAKLGLVRIEVPPLRARAEDIALLSTHFVKRIAENDGVHERPIGEAAQALLARYPWPGNVRELEDTIHRAMLLARGREIAPGDLIRSDGTSLADAIQAATPRFEVESLVGHTVEEVERELILQTLERCHGNRTSASNILGISVRTMRNKLRSFMEAGIPVSPAA